MIFRRHPPRTLKIGLPHGIVKLHPGDILWLTHEAHTDIDNRQRVKAEVTHKYTWDGKVLKQEKP